ncbi:DUF3558 domain-containing protein [Saccharopolyspora sp. WRP15-2]|uniref:DUF3558 domain-containing protein n=1 Tax=Saccharopolyspora oryzae TaxID=2997343 RepID=A0ABT4V343_9PSEU|nr:DUF3558 domain-containing protein [Saccharopolyspora oryzae]MDA3628373.1 DUF3558 domain-containing protein [Saccharopolyspora oryzae]
MGLLIVTSTACADTAGKPVPASTGEQTTPVADDALHIERPKQLKAISDPCQLLTPDQARQLNAGPTSSGQSEWGQADCTWRNQQLRIDIAPDTVQGQGLDWLVKTAGNGKPTAEVNGYPGVRYGISSDSCGTYVATSDTELFLVGFQVGSEGRGNPEYADPCAVTDKVAALVLENLPPA